MINLLNIKDYVAKEKAKISCSSAVKLAIIQVGNNEASNRYVKNKLKDCAELGIAADVIKCSDTIGYVALDLIIKGLVTTYSSIILQMPLPEHLMKHKDELINSIPPHKDVDGFRVDSAFEPCTPAGILHYLEACNFEFNGKTAVVVGRSDIVGKPMAKLLLAKNMTVSVCHSKTPTEVLQSLLANADLVVCAVGKQGVFKSSVAPNAVIIDVGINFTADNKLCGDVIVCNGDESRVTPVPGGVGLLTRLELLKHVAGFCTEAF